MKMTVVTQSDGEIVGFAPKSILGQRGEMQGGLIAGPNQKLHEVEVPDELAAVESGEELHKKLQPHLKQYLSKQK